jgi:hypothetical protein
LLFRDEAGDGGIGWNVSGLCRRAGFVWRDDGPGELRRDCSARQVPSRPLPGSLTLLSSSEGGVEKRREGVKRDARRMSQGSADGRSILRCVI